MKIPHRLLLVEDDAVTRAFFSAVLANAGHSVDAAPDARTALASASSGPSPALLLIDAHLPDADGADLLRTLRAQGCDATAIAHTAEHAPALHDRLRSAGYAQVLLKPLPGADLLRAVAAALPDAASDGMPAPVWDDAAASRALGGAAAQVEALRGLFLAELGPMAQQIGTALRAGQHGQAAAVLHRLQASCGFVGAARLTDAVAALRAHASDAALLTFEAVARETLDATGDPAAHFPRGGE